MLPHSVPRHSKQREDVASWMSNADQYLVGANARSTSVKYDTWERRNSSRARGPKRVRWTSTESLQMTTSSTKAAESSLEQDRKLHHHFGCYESVRQTTENCLHCHHMRTSSAEANHLPLSELRADSYAWTSVGRPRGEEGRQLGITLATLFQLSKRREAKMWSPAASRLRSTRPSHTKLRRVGLEAWRRGNS